MHAKKKFNEVEQEQEEEVVDAQDVTDGKRHNHEEAEEKKGKGEEKASPRQPSPKPMQTKPQPIDPFSSSADFGEEASDEILDSGEDSDEILEC